MKKRLSELVVASVFLRRSTDRSIHAFFIGRFSRTQRRYCGTREAQDATRLITIQSSQSYPDL